MDSDSIREALSHVKYPGFSRDIVSFGLLQDIREENGRPVIMLKVQTSDPKIPETIFKACQEALAPLFPDTLPQIDIRVESPPNSTSSPSSGSEKNTLPGVKKIIAIASGKGGVGKSTVTANLAISLAQQGLKVGLCDCDLYGPSIAHMFGAADQQPFSDEADYIIPIEAHGISLMSMGFLIADDSPVIVRGPLATRYIQQFLTQVAWGELDVLLLDLPPGTGDIQLTIVQTIALDGAIIVTTPQEVSLIDARKAIQMFAKVNVPILGLIENMAYFECDHGTRYHLLGKDGGRMEAEAQNVPLLAQIPLHPEACQAADRGTPITLSDPQNLVAVAFQEVATSLVQQSLK